MSQVAFIKLKKGWNSVENLISSGAASFSFSPNKTYQIECRGSGAAYIMESTTQPSSDNKGGVLLDRVGLKTIEYKKGTGTLYARADVSSYLNITVMGE